MKILFPLIITLLFIGSCHSGNAPSGNQATLHQVDDSIPPLKLSGSLYRFGPQMDTILCKYEAPCDCCMTDLLFTDEKRFIAIFYCLTENTYAQGSYRVVNNKVYISFNGYKVEEISDMTAYNDSAAVSNNTAKASIQYKVDTMQHSVDTLTAMLCHHSSAVYFHSQELDFGTYETKVNVIIDGLTKSGILDSIKYK